MSYEKCNNVRSLRCILNIIVEGNTHSVLHCRFSAGQLVRVALATVSASTLAPPHVRAIVATVPLRPMRLHRVPLALSGTVVVALWLLAVGAVSRGPSRHLEN
jgi:hypothetical protein